jgi:hypothetical protein
VSVRAASGAGSALVRLHALLRDGGGLMATLLGEPGCEDADDRAACSAAVADGPAHAPDGHAREKTPARIAAQGPRARGRREEYELLVEAVYEGYLLHYGAPRVVRVPDADLRLLAGDRLYAVGLARLVALGDTHAVVELADTITLSALARSAGPPPSADAGEGRGERLAEAVWIAGAHAVGWGASEAHARAKRLVLDDAPDALEAMRTSVRELPASP